MIMKTFTYFLLAGILVFSSCVRAVKYQELKTDYDIASEARDKAERRADSLSRDRDKLVLRTQDLQRDLTRLKDDYQNVDSLYRRNKRLTDDLFDKYDRLQRQYNQLLANGNAEAGKLSSDLARREKEVNELEQKMQAAKAELEQRQARIQELEKMISDRDKAMKDLKNKVSNALTGFNSTELTVENRNGRVYVLLQEKLLFRSGSYAIDPRGVDALKKLAGVLRNQPDIEVMVEGHTDDVPLAAGTAGIKDNWDLSVLRATSVTRTLIDGGMDPEQVTPAGKGKFHPVNPAKTDDARRKNRRTEIVLTPKLEELYKVLGTN
jgi:chemotaxis protein MotB